MSDDTPNLRLKSFEVKGLFGNLHHRILLKTHDRITIIHGPNGVGKTSVLRLMAGIFRPEAAIWRQTEFERVTAKFLPSGSVTIRPAEDGRLSYVYKRGRTTEKAELATAPTLGVPLGDVDEVIPWLHRVGPTSWRDSRMGGTVDLSDIIERYPELADQTSESPKSQDALPPLMRAALSAVSTQFIRTHRLRSETHITSRRRLRRKASPHAVEAIAESLAVHIRSKLRESGSLAASLDRTFPKRLLEGRLPPRATEDAIRARYNEQEQLRKRLMNAGLLDAEDGVPLPSTKLGDSERKVLWYYLQDVEQKLQVYMSLLERVELFKKIIDEKDFLFKSIEINERDGLVFKSDTGQDVPLSSLSSGEQHEVVLAYELLFGSRGKQLILIDEPELSLHVMWQRMFLKDMERIARLADLDFVVATHSPSIVNERTDLMVELSGRP